VANLTGKPYISSLYGLVPSDTRGHTCQGYKSLACFAIDSIMKIGALLHFHQGTLAKGKICVQLASNKVA
jgi:hypothetical protein